MQLGLLPLEESFSMPFKKTFFLLLFRMFKNIFSLKVLSFIEHVAEAPPRQGVG